jgi:uncharacterized protein
LFKEEAVNQTELVLAGLAPAKGGSHTPVQVQKLFFLLEKNIPETYNGPLFNFKPYNYGPFDRDVYLVLQKLEEEGLVDIDSQFNWRTYGLTVLGQEEADKIFNQLPKKAKDFIPAISEFVRGLNFTELVRAIYKAYPEMKRNSVFQE